MKISKTMKKVLFFWSIFHLFGYMTFVVGLTPSIKAKTYSHNYEIFLFTPEYTNNLGYLTICPSCYNDGYGEKENFWPFHKFIYSFYNDSEREFIGIWGYYGHYEFLFYMVLPFLVLCLIWVYRRYIKE